jgi:predicted glycoside hydrolase/deacetylase ChbG (UPF0249 family)
MVDQTVLLSEPATGSRGDPHGSGVFFHADDMGATPSITTRICEAWELGLIDSFSVFGDCDHPELIAFRLNAHPNRPARIAVHLNLWEGRPVTPASGVPSLVDRSGHFNGGFLKMLVRGSLGGNDLERNRLLAQVEREWRAQIENVLDLVVGRPLAALDGHLHMHMVPWLYRLAVRLAGEYRIPEIRNVREPFYLSENVREWRSARFAANCVKHRVLAVLGEGNEGLFRGSGLTCPDHTLGVLYSGMMSSANIVAGVAAAARRGAKRIEVLVHIGRADRSELGRWNGNARRAAFALSAARDMEYEELVRLRSPGSLFASAGPPTATGELAPLHAPLCG